MAGLGVIVEYSASSEEESAGAKDKLSCSGIHISNGWILTHGTIAIDLLKSQGAKSLLEEIKTKGYAANERNSPLQTLLDNTKSRFQVIFDGKTNKTLFPSNLSDNIPRELETSTFMPSEPLQIQDIFHHGRLMKGQLQLPLASSSETPSYFCHPANIAMLFIQPGVVQCLAAMMPASQGWRLTEDKEGEESDVDLEAITVASFALLKVTSFKSNAEEALIENRIEELIHLTEKIIPITGVANKGTNVFIESSPFGSLSPSVFLNSLSKGIISNIGGSEKDVYLTDARCVMGAEGAPVYSVVDRKVNLCGMVISPFCWKRGEWLGLSLLSAIRPVLFSLLRSLLYIVKEEGSSINPGKAKEETSVEPVNKSRSFYDNGNFNALPRSMDFLSFEDTAKTVDKVVVGVCCGGGWGSGIVINSSPGVILTCAHVVQLAKFGEVVIITADGKRMSGEVVYHTRPSCFLQGSKKNEVEEASIWDIAVVVTSGLLPYTLPLATELPPKGSPVVVAGHGIFSPNRLPSPTLTHGVISKIVSVDKSNLSYSSINEVKKNVSNMSKDPNQVGSKNIQDSVNILHERNMETCRRKSDVSLNLSNSDGNAKTNHEVNKNGHSSKDEVSLGCDENGLVPVMLQTTCSVYAGNSGGPVVSYHPQHGLQLVGLMVCNTRDLANKATFPHINLAVPAPAIGKILRAYLSSGDKTKLNYLGVQCDAISQLWALGLTPQSNL